MADTLLPARRRACARDRSATLAKGCSAPSTRWPRSKPPTGKYQLPMLTAFVGQIRMAAGDIEGALTLFAEALDLARNNGELFYLAEILRLTSEALMARPPDRPRADHCLLEALDVARAQEAKARAARLRQSPAQGDAAVCR